MNLTNNNLLKSILLLIICIFVISCNENSNKTINNIKTKTSENLLQEDSLIENDNETDTLFEYEKKKKVFYTNQMKAKRIFLKRTRSCIDAGPKDSNYKFNQPYIISYKNANNTISAEFKIKSHCGKEFKGDYKIKNNKMIFTIENYSELLATCYCFHYYKLNIKTANDSIKNFRIVYKENQHYNK
jgi:hypothetical protein